MRLMNFKEKLMMRWRIIDTKNVSRGNNYFPRGFNIYFRSNNNATYLGHFIQGPPNTFFWKMLLKKLLNIFPNFFFYLKVHSFRLIMENDFIQMAASTGHAVTYTIDPILKLIIDCVQLYFTNCFTNIVF